MGNASAHYAPCFGTDRGRDISWRAGYYDIIDRLERDKTYQTS